MTVHIEASERDISRARKMRQKKWAQCALNDKRYLMVRHQFQGIGIRINDKIFQIIHFQWHMNGIQGDGRVCVCVCVWKLSWNIKEKWITLIKACWMTVAVTRTMHFVSHTHSRIDDIFNKRRTVIDTHRFFYSFFIVDHSCN